jgi:hypothetical protein
MRDCPQNSAEFEAHAATMGADVDGQEWIDQMSVLVAHGQLDEAKVRAVIEARNWQEAQRLIRAVSWPVGTAR